MKKALLLLLLPLFLAPATFCAEGITISQSLDKSEIAFEDSALFQIVIKWPGPQTAYLFNKPLQPSIDRLKIRGYSSSISSSTTDGQEITTKTYHYVLIPTSSGEGKIAPVTVDYLSWPDSIPGQLVTEPMSITIALRVIPKKPVQMSPYVWIGILVGLSLTALLVAYIVFKRGKKVEVEEVLTPREKFLQELSGVKQESGQDLKKFQSGLYKILSQYLAEAFNLQIGDRSEDDLKEGLKDTKLSESQVEALIGWLVRARKDKFSPVNAAPGEVIRLESEIKEFFEKLEV
jgi:hypothetical protein